MAVEMKEKSGSGRVEIPETDAADTEAPRRPRGLFGSAMNLFFGGTLAHSSHLFGPSIMRKSV